jgi:membrane protein implicated in regulation of membrane protease activity
MHTWTTIVSLPLCAALTAAGLALSWLTWRRKGPRRGIRVAAWSLLPLAAYLTGAVPMLWRVGSAIANFAQGFVFSARTWAGLTLFILSAVIFLTSGGLPRVSKRKRADKKEVKQQSADDRGAVTPGQGNRAVAQVGAAKTAKAAKPGKGGSGDDDGLDPEVSAILRRHGIS